jgi:hypothetical protein
MQVTAPNATANAKKKMRMLGLSVDEMGCPALAGRPHDGDARFTLTSVIEPCRSGQYAMR